ncbi:MAG: hypothetical protein JST40_00610 [Armatimonadetes bacterium]|nr:hypothetical protein [Armatimonadota bacterium]
MKWLVNGIETQLEPCAHATLTPIGERIYVRTPEGMQTAAVVKHLGKTYVSYAGNTYVFERADHAKRSAGKTAGSGDFLAPMPGMITEVLVEQGEHVQLGQRLLVLEAMKTQQPVTAPFEGIVEVIKVSRGQQVAEGELLVRVVPPTPDHERPKT